MVALWHFNLYIFTYESNGRHESTLQSLFLHSECSTVLLRASILRADSWTDGQGYVYRLRRHRCARVAALDRKDSVIVAGSQRTAIARYIDHNAFSWHKRTIGVAGAQPGIRRCDRPVERPGPLLVIVSNCVVLLNVVVLPNASRCVESPRLSGVWLFMVMFTPTCWFCTVVPMSLSAIVIVALMTPGPAW